MFSMGYGIETAAGEYYKNNLEIVILLPSYYQNFLASLGTIRVASQHFISIICSLSLTITRCPRVKPWVWFWWCYLVHKNAMPASFLHHVIVGRTKEYYSHKRIALDYYAEPGPGATLFRCRVI